MRTSVVVLACALAACHHDSRWLAPEPAPPIDGAATTGRDFHLADLRGRAVLITFGYGACADLCPITFGKMKRLIADLGDADAVDVVYVTLDPERDSVESLRARLAKVDPHFIGVRVDAASLPPILDAYGVSARKRVPDPWGYAAREADAGGFYSMDHTAAFWGIDRAGDLRFRFPHEATSAELCEAVRALL